MGTFSLIYWQRLGNILLYHGTPRNKMVSKGHCFDSFFLSVMLGAHRVDFLSPFLVIVQVFSYNLHILQEHSLPSVCLSVRLCGLYQKKGENNSYLRKYLS